MKLKVKANIGKNRLYFTFIDQTVKKELDKLYTDVRFCVADLQPGFDVISDFSQCSFMHLSSISTFRKIMNFLISNKVGEIVRIIDNDSLVYKQISNLSSMICSYRPLYVTNLEEAEEKLEKSIKRNGIRFHIHHLPVVYITANETEGKGNISNLSTSGCAVESAIPSVLMSDEITMTIVFTQDDGQGDEFILKARVVRTEGDTFAAEFQELEDEKKDQLWKCLLREAERQI